MDAPAVGELVTVSTGGPPADGIVFEIPSARKVVVAVADPQRGPALRTVPPEALSARESAGRHDATSPRHGDERRREGGLGGGDQAAVLRHVDVHPVVQQALRNTYRKPTTTT